MLALPDMEFGALLCILDILLVDEHNLPILPYTVPYKMNAGMATALDYGNDPSTHNKLATAQSAPYWSLILFVEIIYVIQ